MYGWSGICIFHKMKRKRKKKRSRTRWRLSSQKERWVWYDYSSQWRETLFMYLFERSDFWWLWLESLSSSSFISFWEIPNDESKSLTRWNCDEKCDRIRSSDRSGYHIVSMIFDFFWNRSLPQCEAKSQIERTTCVLFNDNFSKCTWWRQQASTCLLQHS